MTTKRFIKLQFVFLLIIAIFIIPSTYSWSNRPKVTGGAFMSANNTDGNTTVSKDKTYFTAIQLVTPENGYYINGSSCTATTYIGTYDRATGLVDYGEEPTVVDSFNDVLGGNSVTYFKTEITNASTATTNVSLFISGSIDKDISQKVKLGVTSPIATSFAFNLTGEVTGNLPFEWYPIATKFQIAPNGTAYIEWYVENTYTNEGFFEISDIILTNN